MNIQALIQKIGLTGRETQVYVQVIKEGPISPSELALSLVMARPNVYEVAKKLEAQGFLHYQLVNKKRLLVAEAPERLVEFAQQKVAAAKNAVPLLNYLSMGKGFQSNISFYQGKKAMQNLFKDALTTKSKEIWYLWPPKDMDKILNKLVIERFITARLKKGIKIRSLRPVEKESLYAVESDTDFGKKLTEVAYVPEQNTFSLAMALYDTKVAFFSSQKESFGFLVESKEFSQVMRMFYQMLWSSSGKLRA